MRVPYVEEYNNEHYILFEAGGSNIRRLVRRDSAQWHALHRHGYPRTKLENHSASFVSAKFLLDKKCTHSDSHSRNSRSLEDGARYFEVDRLGSV